MKKDFSGMQTKNCVYCFKPAVTWTGHVLWDSHHVIAGWCEEHEKVPGFCGHYKEEMEVEDFS